MADPTLIIFRHGPYSFYAANMAGLPEGEPYEFAVLDDQGNAITALAVGGHDGQNKILGGGFQVYAGDLSNVIAPQGVAVVDTNLNLQISTGSGWKQQGGGNVAANIDCGSYW